MLRAYAHEFSLVDRTLKWALNNAPTAEGAALWEQVNGKSWRAWTNDELQKLEPLLKELPLGPAVRKQLVRTQGIFAKRAGLDEAHKALSELHSRFRDELEDLQFLHVSAGRVPGYEARTLFGAAVEQAFPSSVLEIQDAGRCIALNQGTAGVFHTMRALEPALIALGKKFEVNVAENWNSALNDIEAAIRDRPSKKNWPNWREEEPFYAQACTHFFMIKNAWRNHTMHLRLRFAPKEALGIFESTKAFMIHLASRLSETSSEG